MKGFADRLAAASAANRSLLCVGLDPDPELMAVPDVAEFNRAIIDATRDLVCAYKPNLPFYEALGREGFDALERTLDHIREAAPGVVIVGDAKRGDIASTNTHYARALFDVWGFDAATVNAYAGGDALDALSGLRRQRSNRLVPLVEPGSGRVPGPALERRRRHAALRAAGEAGGGLEHARQRGPGGREPPIRVR